MRITIKDIAERAGVSKTTVSFAFNDPSKISKATYASVMAIAGSLGYVPDPVARTLTTKRTGAIGLLLPRPIHEAFRDPYLAEIIQGIGAACLESEYSLTIVPPLRGRMLEGGGSAVVDALLAIGIDRGHEVVELMRKRCIPLVRIDGDQSPGAAAGSAGFASVGIDDEAAARDLARHLVGLGHRRIAVMSPDPEADGLPGRCSAGVEDRRMAGIARAFSEAGLDPSGLGLECRPAPCSIEGGLVAGGQILDEGRATAVMAMSDIIAMGLYLVCDARGVRIPEDLSVVSFDGTEVSSVLRPGLTHIMQSGREKGYVAAAAVLSMLSRGLAGIGAPPAPHAIRYELVVRASTAAPRGTARPA